MYVFHNVYQKEMTNKTKIKISNFYLFLIFGLIASSGLANENIIKSPDIQNILFIGNSYTGLYDVPDMVQIFSDSADHQIVVDTYLEFGSSLYEISQNIDIRAKINSNKWDYIVLQDAPHRIAYPDNYYSLIPWADAHALRPTLQLFRDMAIENNPETHVVYFMPWAFKDGMLWIQGHTDDFFSMQEKIYTNSIIIGTDLNLKIAPVGWAWYKVLKEPHNNIELFNPDLSHSSLEGSYLTACVFYVTIFKEILNSNYYSSVTPEIAIYLQSIASATVLDDIEFWHLDTTASSFEIFHDDLYQNFPNPFNTETNISFSLEQKEFVSLDIYNILGTKVASLINNEMEEGPHTVHFSADRLTSGVYYYRLKTSEVILIKSMILIK